MTIAVMEPLFAHDIVRIMRAGLPLTRAAERWSDLLLRAVRPLPVKRVSSA